MNQNNLRWTVILANPTTQQNQLLLEIIELNNAHSLN
jgi:hypothetical protein